jgi:hypothetical protein
MLRLAPGKMAAGPVAHKSDRLSRVVVSPTVIGYALQQSLIPPKIDVPDPTRHGRLRACPPDRLPLRRGVGFSFNLNGMNRWLWPPDFFTESRHDGRGRPALGSTSSSTSRAGNAYSVERIL